MNNETKATEPKETAPKKETSAPAKKPAPKKEKKGLGKKIREIFSELKKVTWPTFQTALKQTGVVFAVVLFFIVIITAVDTGLSQLLKLIKNAGSTNV